MNGDHPELDELQSRLQGSGGGLDISHSQRGSLASVNHDVAEVDAWEAAHFEEDEMRTKVKDAKAKYEDALREKFFGF